MKTVQDLVNAKKEIKKGNHRVEHVQGWKGFTSYTKERKFIYYATTICAVNDENKTFWIDASYGTKSTTRACNAYRKHFKELGYTEIDMNNMKVVV